MSEVVVIVANHEKYRFHTEFGRHVGCHPANVADSVIRLIRRYGGDVQAACDWVKHRLFRVRWEVETVKHIPRECFQKWDSQTNFIDFLTDIDPSKFVATTEHRGKAFEYTWMFNFDTVTITNQAHKMTVRWTMKQLYRLGDAGLWMNLSEINRSSQWGRRAGHFTPSAADDERNIHRQVERETTIAAVTIQHWWRVRRNEINSGAKA